MGAALRGGAGLFFHARAWDRRPDGAGDAGDHRERTAVGRRELTHDYSPWLFWSQAGGEEQSRQIQLQKEMGYSFGERCFVSELASVQNEELALGPRSYIAA